MTINLRRPGIKQTIVLLLVGFCTWQFSFAQVKVTGIITDAEQGVTLPGVNVLEQGTTNGTITDVDGNYTITVEGPGSTLVFSFVGYESMEVLAGNATTLNVALKTGLALEEVVVVGFGTQKKESVVGAITQVSGDELVSSGTSNVSTAIHIMPVRAAVLVSVIIVVNTATINLEML